MALRPSFVGRAPMPPPVAMNSLKTWPRRSRPRTSRVHRIDDDSAMTRSGTAWASAPITASGRKSPIRWRLATGAGRTAFSSEPSGAVMVTGRNEPALFGTWGATTHFTP